MDVKVNVPIPEVDPKDQHASHSPKLIITSHQTLVLKMLLHSTPDYPGYWWGWKSRLIKNPVKTNFIKNTVIPS
jgi:hypothetical protein